MKKVLAVALALTLALGCFLFAGSAAAETTIILGHFGAPNEPVTKAAETFKAQVEALSGGSMVVEIHGASELGNAVEMAEQAALGAIQACLVSQGTLDKYDIRYALITAPYVYSGYEQAYAVVDGPFAEWVADGTLEAKGLHNVAVGLRLPLPDQLQARGQASRGREGAEDPHTQRGAEGGLLRGAGRGRAADRLQRADYGPQAKDRGRAGKPAFHDLQQQHVGSQPDLLKPHPPYLGGRQPDLQQQLLGELTDEQRSVVEQAAAVARDQMRTEVQASEQDYIQKLEAEGVTVTEVDLAEFKAAMAPAWDRVAEYEGSAEDMAKFLQMVEDTAK